MLFSEGHSFFYKGIKVLYRCVPRTDGLTSDAPLPAPVRLLVVVPKRVYKRANQRNLFRRRLREAWRLQKHLFDPHPDTSICLHVALLYLHKRPDPYEHIHKIVGKAIEKLNNEIQSHSQVPP